MVFNKVIDLSDLVHIRLPRITNEEIILAGTTRQVSPLEIVAEWFVELERDNDEKEILRKKYDLR